MSKNGCDLPQEVREDVIPLTNPEIENLVDGVDFQDHFEGLEKMTNLVDGGDFQHHIEGLERRADLVDGDDFQDNLRADLVDGDDFQDILRADLVDGVNFQDHFEGLERADLVNDNSSDSDFAQYVEDDVESNAPSEALDDIEGSDDDNIFDERPSTKTEMINKLKGMLKKARRKSSRMKSFQIVNEEENPLWYTDADDDEDIDTPVYLNGKVHKQSIFKEGDTMKNKNFEQLMKFENVKVFRGALRDWIVRNGYELNFEKNEKSRVTAVCKVEGCTWRIHASNVQGSPVFMVKTLTGEHNCAKSTVNKHATSTYLAERMAKSIKDNPDVAIPKLQNSIRTKCVVDVGYWKSLRAKKKAMIKIMGQDEAEYKLLWDYCETVRNANPGSRMLLKKIPDSDPPVFSKMYFSLASMKWGFLAGCRPLIGLDGCFLKTPHGGQLLAAVGRDGNDNLFPIALAVVHVESRETWTWFLEVLLDDIGGVEDSKWTFISDRQKGLIETLKELAPNCPHRYCMRHLYANFKEKWSAPELKTLFWRAAATANRNEFDTYMKSIKKTDPKKDAKIETAWEWLNKIPPCHWARAFFPTDCKSDVLVNNLCESFNNFILEAREKPVLSMFEWIRNRLTVRIQVKRSGIEKLADGAICPNIMKKMNKCKEIARHFSPRWCGNDEFKVEHFADRYVVRLNQKVCSCGMFQLMGYPCSHAWAAIAERRYNLADFVDDYYKKEMYMKAYDFMIHVVPGPKDYIKTTFVPLLPPVCKKKAGRPKKMRRKAPDEIHRSSARQGLTHTCANCLQPGHNRLTCKNPTHPSSKPSKPKRKARRRRTSNVNEATRRRTSNVNEATGQEANDRTAATPQTRNPLNAATHEAANSTPAAATHLSNNQPTSVHQNPLLAAIQNAYTPTAAIRQLGVNPRLAATHETMPTENRGQVYEGRRNAALLGTSNWKDLQQAQSISTSQAASDGQNVQKRIRKPIDIQVLQNIRESSKKRIWKP